MFDQLCEDCFGTAETAGSIIKKEQPDKMVVGLPVASSCRIPTKEDTAGTSAQVHKLAGAELSVQTREGNGEASDEVVETRTHMTMRVEAKVNGHWVEFDEANMRRVKVEEDDA